MPLRTDCSPHVDATILDAAALLALALGGATLDVHPQPAATDPALAGTWRSADDTVRLRLAQDGTYEGSVAGRARAARGTYRADADSLLLRDDSGLRTPVGRRGDILQMAGYDLRRD